MSFCSKCGAQITSDSQQFCTKCGSKLELSSDAVTSQNDGATVYEQQGSTHPDIYNPVPPADKDSMKWFKFLIYFALFFGALMNLVFGANYITGGIYFVQSDGQVTADAVYGMYGDGLKILDVIYGVIMILMAGFNIYTRFRLAKYKKNGPFCIISIYSLNALLPVVYNFGLLLITSVEQLFSASSIMTFLIGILICYLNERYFMKRKKLFNN